LLRALTIRSKSGAEKRTVSCSPSKSRSVSFATSRALVLSLDAAAPDLFGALLEGTRVLSTKKKFEIAMTTPMAARRANTVAFSQKIDSAFMAEGTAACCGRAFGLQKQPRGRGGGGGGGGEKRV
jgi:hypothetical protein